MNDPILLNVTLVVIAAVGIWAPFRWKGSAKAQKVLILFVVEMFVTGFAEVILSYFYMPNLWLISLSTWVEFILIVIIFYYLKTKKRDKFLLLLAGGSFTLFWLISKLTFEPMSVIGNYTSVVARLLQIYMSVSVLFDILKDTDVHLKNDPRIWVASGIIIYSTGSLLLFILFMDIVKISLELFKLVWHINFILNIVSDLLYARGIWCKKTQ